MTKVNWLEVFCGLGVFLFSLRLLNALIERSLAKRLRPVINRLVASPARCLGLGVLSTIFVQASSITIITTMGLLNTSLITLEQSFLVMLGSTVGTTLKIWIFADNVRGYALLMIGLASFSLFIFRKTWTRDFWEILLALGMAFFGFNIMALELMSMSGSVALADWLRSYNSSTLGMQLLGILMGCIAAVLVQSSSTCVLLILGFAGKGLIPYDAAILLILGANIGTASTSLFVAVDHGVAARRLAISHFLVKIVGVLIVLLCFPYFLALVDLLIPGPSEHSKAQNCEYHLACAHTLFNFCNLLLWTPLSYLMVKFITWLIPGEQESNVALPNVVRQILISNPNLTIQEIENQIHRAETQAKILTDYCFDMLIHDSTRFSKKQRFSHILVKNFECIKECILELLIKLRTRHSLKDEKKQYTQQQLKFTHEYSNFYYHALDLCDHLERGLLDKFTFPPPIKSKFEQLQILFNEMWFAVFQKKACTQNLDAITKLIADLEESYFSMLSQSTLQYEELSWIYETLNYLGQITTHLHQLCNFVSENQNTIASEVCQSSNAL